MEIRAKLPLEEGGINWEWGFWGERNVLHLNRATDYRDAYISKTSPSCTFKIDGFQSMYGFPIYNPYIIPQLKMGGINKQTKR